MASGKRKRSGGPEVSLFPFLSILACVIGTLTLMITAMALGQMDNPIIESVEQYDRTEGELAEEQANIKNLSRRIAETQADSDQPYGQLLAAERELKKARAELLRLKSQPPVKTNIPQIDAPATEQRLAELAAELKKLQQRIDSLLSEIARRGRPAEAQVTVRPGGTGVGLNPTFVECTATGLVVHGDKELWRIRRAEIRTNAPFLKLLDKISQRPKDTIVFLLRDDALPTYQAARAIAQSRFARNGKLPVVGHGTIDLSQFKTN